MLYVAPGCWHPPVLVAVAVAVLVLVLVLDG
jgi:hypothetical protein